MMKDAIQQRPNVPALMLEDLINHILPNKYSYVGDWAIFIGGINPDFISNDGENKVIEMFGDHWHKGENPQERIDKFAEQGLDCLVIWEHELWEESLEELVKKILEFDKA